MDRFLAPAGEYSVPQLREKLREVERILARRISPEEWNHL